MPIATQNATDSITANGWRATLRLRFGERAGRTFLSERAHRGPLMVQRAFYPEAHVCHCYVVHPPGGVVGGDQLSLDVGVDPQANALLTTPAAGKFYRSEGAYANLAQRLQVDDGASLEWLPQETIYYRGAHVRARTSVELSSGSRFLGWEVHCLGLPARAELFDDGCLRLGFELQIDGSPRWLDHMRIDGHSCAPSGSWGLAGFTAIGTMLAYPATPALLEELRSVSLAEAELAVTLVDQVLVCRALSDQAGRARLMLMECWRRLRPGLLGRAAVAPRIWAT